MAGILDLVTKNLTSEAVDQLGKLTGMTGGDTSTALGSVIPAILAKMTSAGETERGAKAFGEAVDSASSGPSFDWMSMLSGDSSSLIKAGGSLLGSLLGGDRQTSGLVDVLSQFLGQDKAGIGKLVAAAAPMIINVLAGQRREGGLDNAGLLSMLTSQKDQFTNAMPSGLLGQLDTGGRVAAERVEDVQQVAKPAERRGGIPWWVWALVLAGLAVLYMNFSGGGGERAGASDPASVEQDAFSGLLAQVSDAAKAAQAGNANECVDLMRDANSNLAMLMGKMSADEMQSKLEQVSAFVAQLQGVEAGTTGCAELADFRQALQDGFKLSN